jgi:hypothetical protein
VYLSVIEYNTSIEARSTEMGVSSGPGMPGSKADKGKSDNPAKGSLSAGLGGAYGKPGEDNMAKSEAAKSPSRVTGKQTEGGNGANPAPEPEKHLPTGVTPLTEPKPMGATPYVEGADPIGVAARFLGGIGGGVMSALGLGLAGEDPTESMLGESLGKQTGWSADPSMTPGRDRAQRGTQPRESFTQTATSVASGKGLDEQAAEAEDFSDITLADRRKPGLKQMLETML